MLQSEESAIEFYRSLFSSMPQAREVLKSILEDEYKHYEAARKLYSRLYGGY